MTVSITATSTTVSASARTALLVDGEFPLAAEDFSRIAAILSAEAGIALPDSKAALVSSRLAKRLRALGLRSFHDYRRLLDAPGSHDERREMLAALTTNVTRFFREPHHFEHLRTVLLPPLLAAARRGGRVRIWSAAASSGPEPYSIALEVLEQMPDAHEHDVRVLATDIDPNMVSAGRAGTYAPAMLEPVPPEMLRRWFEPAEGGTGTMRAGAALRSLVSFRELNLIGTWPMRGHFDAVFCRNVVIYFDETTQVRLWSRMAPLILPGGMLYIGHSERLAGEAAARFRTETITAYRRLDDAVSKPVPGGAGR